MIEEEEQSSEQRENIELQKLLSVVCQIIRKHYYPALDLSDADFTLSTQQVFEGIQQLIPSEGYSVSDVVILLTGMGYKFEIIGQMTFAWMFREL